MFLIQLATVECCTVRCVHYIECLCSLQLSVVLSMFNDIDTISSSYCGES